MTKFVIKPLKDITAIMTKGITPKYTEKTNSNTIIVLNQKCNRNFTISLEAARFNDCTKKTIPTEKILQPYDVLINSTGTGTAGRIAQLFDISKSMTIDGHMLLLRPTKEIEPIYYVYEIKDHQN